jgi:two-component system, cell cycle sensor histidine kinase and response regulator CckA
MVVVNLVDGVAHAQSASPKPLIVGSEEDYPPFSIGNSDETASGFTVELWKSVAAEHGLNYEIRVLPFRQILDEFKSGQIDVLINLAQSDERRTFADFSVPHVTVHGAIFVRRDETHIKSEADLTGKEILVLNADLAHDYAISKGWKQQLILVDNVADGLKRLARGKHDAMLLSRFAGTQTLLQEKIFNVKALKANAGFSQKFSIAVKKGNSQLLAKVNDGLTSAKATGIHDALYEKWFGAIEGRQVTLAELLKYLGPFGLITAVFVAINWVKQRERKKSEEAVRGSEERLRAAMSASGTGTFRWNIRTNELVWDEPLNALFGLPAGQTVRSLAKFIATVHPDDRPGVVERCDRCAREGVDFDMEFRVNWPDGTVHWLDDKGKVFFDDTGKPLYMTGACVDVTSRKLAEEKLRMSVEFTESLISSMQDGFAVLDAHGVQTDVNPAFCKMTGLSRDEMIGTGAPFPYWPPEEYERIQAALNATMNDNLTNFELTFMRRNGQRFPVIVSPSAVKNQAGETISYCATIKDITDRNLADEALRRSEAQFRTLAESAPILIHLTDQDGNCIYVNRRWCQAAGMTQEEAWGQGWLNALHEEDRSMIGELWKKSVASGGSWGFEYRFDNRAGQVTWVYGTAAPILAENGKPIGYVGTNVDISATRQAKTERELFDRKMRETQKLESLGVLAGGIAHDFNNLLTAILGNASVAQMKLPPESPAQDCIEQINEATRRAADLCKQMLAYSGRGHFIVQTLDLGELVKQTAKMLQISINKKSVLQYHLESGLPPVQVDATQLQQVIMNLVINASEAIGDHGGVILISTGLVKVDLNYRGNNLHDPDLPLGEYVFLDVTDNGSGMSAETKAKIFDPFFTTKFTGRGLGLAAVQGIVRGHKGAMKVESTLGSGTTFKLLFPAATGESDSIKPMEEANPAWQGMGTVLVVDDEAMLRTVVAGMLPMLGFDCVLAADGREAVEIFSANPNQFDLVLLDLTMPNMDGEQTLTELRRLQQDACVILMSGFNAQEAQVRFNGKGLASFLQKPFTIATLGTTIHAALNGKTPVSASSSI